MEKTLSELIREYKDGGKRNFEKIAEKMNPLIEFYARKLYTWTGRCQAGDATGFVFVSGKNEILQE